MNLCGSAMLSTIQASKLPTPSVLRLNLQNVAVRVLHIDEPPVNLIQRRLNHLLLLPANLRVHIPREALRHRQRARRRRVLTDPLDDAHATHGIQPPLRGLHVRHDDADVADAVGLFAGRHNVATGHVEVDHLDEALGVVLLARELLRRLVARAVAPAVGVAQVCDGEVLRGAHREDVPQAEDVGVEVDARGEVVHVEREVVDEVARRGRVGRGVAAEINGRTTGGIARDMSRTSERGGDVGEREEAGELHLEVM